MFIGHFGLAFAAKKVAPKPSLGTLGWESVDIVPGITAVTPLLFKWYPYTHSLVAGVVWAMLLAGAYYGLRRDRSGAWWIAALVLSHWVLDFVSHRPDMPLWPGSPLFGMGLWYSMPATLAVEFLLFGTGVWLYISATRTRDLWGQILLWTFVGLLAVIYVASVFGPPPPSVRVLAMSGLLGWLFVAWAYWIDRHRTAIPA
jgi:hypothetical protein